MHLIFILPANIFKDKRMALLLLLSRFCYNFFIVMPILIGGFES